MLGHGDIDAVQVPDPESAILITVRSWSRLPDLAAFAVARHGFGNTDGGYGITYPDDLDDHDREVEGAEIPSGFVEVYGTFGFPDGFELLVSEWQYLDTLAKFLSDSGLQVEADRVEAIAREINPQ